MPFFSRGVLFSLFLLAVLLCSSAATLDTEERQKEEKARESARVDVSEGAADGAPEPPQNLMVLHAGYSAIYLTWTEPSSNSDVDHYYVYVEGEDNDYSTTDNYCLVNNLEGCTNYTFGVTSVSASGNMSDPLLGEGQTEVGPPPAPQNLQVDNFMSTSVTLTWDEPDTLCDVEEYQVRWSEDGTGTQETWVTETSYTVTNLTKNTTYTFSVSASTSYGTGEEATVEQTTPFHDGGPPEDLVATGVSTSAINASWSPPAYEPNYYVVTAPPCRFLEQIVYDLSYLITGLDPCQSCSISVTSHYDQSIEYTANTMGTSQSGDPPQPDGCSVQVQESVITVNWNRPSSSCVIRLYSVNWTWTKLWGDGEEGSDNTTTAGTKVNVFDPVPYTKYSFNVSASIDGLFGSPTSCSGTSEEALPGPPVILAVDSVQGKALVTWEPPAEENGVIVNYEIYVDERIEPDATVNGETLSTSVELEACKSFNLSVKARNGKGLGPASDKLAVTVVDDILPGKVDCAAGDFQVEVCWEPDKTCPVSQYNLEWEGDVLWSEDLKDSNSTTMEWNETRTCYTIPALPYTEYYVKLSVGSGTDDISCSSITPMAAPGPPEDVALTTEDFRINVTWTEPEQKNGIIDIYKVEWKNSTGIIGSKTTEDNSTFSFTILELLCGMTVDVTVSAKVETVIEFGTASPPQTAYLVNSVTTLNCMNTVPGEVSLSWTLEDAECQVNSYNLTWSYNSLWSHNTGGSSDDLEGGENSYTVPSLPPYSSVSVQIHVDNNPEYTDCSTTTLEEASSPPTPVEQIANGTSSVTVKWGPPDAINGKLTGWKLRWTTLNEDPIGEDEVTQTENMTYEISELSSSTTYVVYVMAVNGFGEGEPGKVNAATIAVSEPSKLGLIIGLSVGGGVLLIILLVGGFILYRKKNAPKPPRSAPHMPKVADADSDELYKMHHYSSASQRFQDKIGSVDFGTNSELYTSPRPSLPKDEPEVDDADNLGDGQLTSADGRPQMFGAPPGRRFSQQVSTNLPRLDAYSRRPSQQVNSRMRNFEEYNRRPSQQDLVGRPSLSGGPGKPSLKEYGRRPSQQVDVGRPNLKEYGRRPSQQVDLGKLNQSEYSRRPSQQVDLGKPTLGDYGRRPSQQVDLGKPRLGDYGRRPSQQVDLGKPRLGDYGRRPSQQVDLGKPTLGDYGRRPSQQIDLGRSTFAEYGRRPSQQTNIGTPISGEFTRRPSQELPSGGGSYPSRFSQEVAPRRSSVDLYSRRSSQQSDSGRPGDRMDMRRPSKQFVMSFEGIQEL